MGNILRIVIRTLFDWIILSPTAIFSRTLVSRKLAGFQWRNRMNFLIIAVAFIAIIYLARCFTYNGRASGDAFFFGSMLPIIWVWLSIISRYPSARSGLMLTIPFLRKHVSIHLLRPDSSMRTRHAWRAIPKAVREIQELGFSEIVAESPLLVDEKVASSFTSRMTSALAAAYGEGTWRTEDDGTQTWPLYQSILFETTYGDTLTSDYLKQCPRKIFFGRWTQPQLLVRKIHFIKH